MRFFCNLERLTARGYKDMATRVIIADDDVITRLDIREALEYQGYDVVGEAAEDRKSVV